MKMGEGSSAPDDCVPTTAAAATLLGGSLAMAAAAVAVSPTAGKCATAASSGCSENVSGDAFAAYHHRCEQDGCCCAESHNEQTTPPTELEDASGAAKRQEDTSSCSDDINVDCDCLATKLERSLSLSPRHTAPVSPRRKKAVRFADALGLDLETVKHFLNSSDPPFVPESATRGLILGDVPSRFRRHLEPAFSDFRSYITLRFSQPGAAVDFISEVAASQVMMENCVVDKDRLVVNGTVRVANIAYDKQVAVRYTFDGWVTCGEVRATYVHGSNDGPTDRFTFSLYLQPYFGAVAGSRIEFAVRYDTPGLSRWDNNHGRNYVIECYVPSFYVGTKPPTS